MDATMEPKVPIWVTRAAGEQVCYLMHKQISSSNVCNQRNRLLIDKRVNSERLYPAMPEEEKQAASFLDLLGGERRRRTVGRNHGGLKVIVYDQKGWGLSFVPHEVRRQPLGGVLITEIYETAASWRQGMGLTVAHFATQKKSSIFLL